MRKRRYSGEMKRLHLEFDRLIYKAYINTFIMSPSFPSNKRKILNNELCI